jgi:hypothetical protein
VTLDPAAAEHVRQLVESAPPLTPAQFDRLAVLFTVADDEQPDGT